MTPQSGNLVSPYHDNSGLFWTVSAPVKGIAVPVERQSYSLEQTGTVFGTWDSLESLTDTDLCSCGETQTMSHIVESCPLTKLNGGLSQLHSAAAAAIAWLTNYGS